MSTGSLCQQVSFKPVRGYWFTSYLVNYLKSMTGCIEVTLDLGLTSSRVCVEDSKIIVNEFELSIKDIEPSEEDRVVIVEQETGDIYEVLIHTESGFYKLKAISMDKAPTLEINGIHMHRIQGIDPWMDTLLKIKAARIKRGNKVLDTCMGLGYTSIASIRSGAVEVYTFEIDKNVIWISMRNPWSSPLESREIRMFHGDVTKCIRGISDEYFDRVIHDPPRFTRQTGDLYSQEFYIELYRILKPGGILFHYTGEPRKHSGISILKGIKKRLENAGFKIIGYDREAQGYVALKLI